MTASPKAAFFDMDSTLLDCNSVTLWMRYEWNDRRIGMRDVAWGMWYLMQYQVGSGSVDAAFHQAVATLKGTEEAYLRERTTTWFEAQVRRRLRPGGAKALAEHRERGDRLVLATSSSVYASEAAVKAFGLDDIVCSRFEVVDGLFTGRVAASAFGAAKAERVAEYAAAHGIDLATSTFYTDSITDLALMERVGKPVAVNPDRSLSRVARERSWPIVDWGLASPPDFAR